MYERDVDVLCVCETWLNDNIPNEYVNIADYCIYRCDGGRGGGGGTCIYVKKELTTNIISFEIIKHVAIEDIYLSIQQYHKLLPAITVACVYRRPKANAES